jgi:hypothetical protein
VWTEHESRQLPEKVEASRFRHVCLHVVSKIPPRLVVIPKIDTPSHFQIRSGVGVRVRFSVPPSISQPRESILRPHVRVIEIFPSRLSSHPCDVGSTSRPHAVNSTSRPSSIGPRTAILAENCPREERIAILDEIVCRLFLGRYGCDVLVGYFAEHFGYICHLCFCCLGKCA